MSAPLRRVITESPASKSTAKYGGDYKKDLSDLIAHIEASAEKSLPEHCTLNSIISSTTDMKIRVTDEQHGIDRILSVICRYHHDDVWYGQVHIEIAVAEVSQKNKVHFLGKYSIRDQQTIREDILKALIYGATAP